MTGQLHLQHMYAVESKAPRSVRPCMGLKLLQGPLICSSSVLFVCM